MSEPGAEVIYQFTDRKLRAGDRLAPFEVPAAKLAGRTVASLRLTVDDPDADPPTDAKMEGTIETSADDGTTWRTVATIWAGMSGVIESRIAITDQRVRVAGRCDLAATVSSPSRSGDVAWTFVDGTEATAASGTTLVLNCPAGLVAGDAIVAITRANFSFPYTSTGGWFTQVDSANVGSSDTVQTWIRIADGSEPGTFTLTCTGGSNLCGVTLCLRPPSGAGLLDVHSIAANGSSVNFCAPSVVSGSADDAMIWGFVSPSNFAFTQPSGYTKVTTADIVGASSVHVAACYKGSQGAGATSDVVVGTSSTAAINVATLVALVVSTTTAKAGSDTGAVVSTAVSAALGLPTTDTGPIGSTTASVAIGLATIDTGPMAATEATRTGFGSGDLAPLAASDIGLGAAFVQAADGAPPLPPAPGTFDVGFISVIEAAVRAP